MSDLNQQIMNAMYTQQRLQVLSLGVHHDEFSDAYLYAWYEGVYPFFEDTDGSVQRMPHEHYQSQFLVSREKVDELSKYLDDCWLKGKVPTFYDLEDRYTGWSRSDLIDICRYMFLRRMFDSQFWGQLLTPMQHPSEAAGITRALNREEDIYF